MTLSKTLQETYNHALKITIPLGMLFAMLVVGGFMTRQPVEAATQCVGSCCVTCSNSLCTKIISSTPCNTTCEQPVNCGGGVSSCGSCPDTPPPGLPPPPGFPPPAPQCNPTLPSVPQLELPVNGATVVTNTNGRVYFNWAPVTWGWGCPNTNGYRLYYGIRNGAACDNFSQDITNSSALVTETAQSGDMSYMYRNNFLPNTIYCWAVRAENGANVRYSALREFTTLPAPVVTNTDFINVDKCGGQPISGRASFPNTNNPITYTVDVSHPSNDFAAGRNFLSDVRIGMLQNNVANATLVRASVLEPNLRDRMGFRVNLSNFASPTYQAANTTTAPYWGSPQSSGSLPNAAGNATLVNIGTGTKVTQIDNTTLRVEFQVRLEDSFPSFYTHSLYIMANIDFNSDLYSQDPVDVSDSQYYRKYNEWRTDMIPPSVIVSDPYAYSNALPNNFRVSWTANDAHANGNSPLRSVLPECFATDGNVVSFNQVGANPAFSVNLSADGTPQVCYNGANPPAAQPWVVDKNYSVTSGDIYFGVTFRFTAEDVACNISTTTNSNGIQGPWVKVHEGQTSALGYSGFHIPDINLYTYLPPYGDTPYLSMGTTIATGGQMIGARQSIRETFTTNYNNLAARPQSLIGLNTWYDTMYKIINDRYPGVMQNMPGTVLPLHLNAYASNLDTVPHIFKYTGNITTTNSGSTAFNCSRDAIFFIDGDLNINYNVLRTGQFRCVFVVRGNLTFGIGSKQNAADGRAVLNYDTMAGLYIVDGTITVPNDPRITGYLPDGFLVLGNLVANTIDLQRDIEPFYNSRQPADLINYDASFWRFWSDVFGVNKYSIRPK